MRYAVMNKKYIEHAVEAMDEEELVKIANNVLRHPEYCENENTRDIRMIINDKFIIQHRQVIKAYLVNNSRLWYGW